MWPPTPAQTPLENAASIRSREPTPSSHHAPLAHKKSSVLAQTKRSLSCWARSCVLSFTHPRRRRALALAAAIMRRPMNSTRCPATVLYWPGLARARTCKETERDDDDPGPNPPWSPGNGRMDRHHNYLLVWRRLMYVSAARRQPPWCSAPHTLPSERWWRRFGLLLQDSYHRLPLSPRYATVASASREWPSRGRRRCSWRRRPCSSLGAPTRSSRRGSTPRPAPRRKAWCARSCRRPS
jgi:hypothetical protein